MGDEMLADRPPQYRVGGPEERKTRQTEHGREMGDSGIVPDVNLGSIENRDEVEHSLTTNDPCRGRSPGACFSEFCWSEHDDGLEKLSRPPMTQGSKTRS